jgi:hypothetical protein
MSNAGIDVWESFARWVPHQVGTRAEMQAFARAVSDAPEFSKLFAEAKWGDG